MKSSFLVGAAVFLSSAGLFAQSDDVDMSSEVRFLRGLAKDWGFVQLAQDRLGELRRASTTSDDSQRQISQVEAEVLYLGARRIRNMAKRRTVLSEALQKFDDYLSQYGRDDGASQVLASQAEACEYFGGFLSQAIALEKDPDKKKEFEEEALNVFMKGIKASNEAMSNLEPNKDKNSRAKVSFYLSWMRKGTLLREWAKTVAKDREVKGTEAIETLESLALDIGEETAIGIKALLEMAVAQDVVGETVDAMDAFEGTIEIVVDRCKDEESPIPLSTQQLLFRFLEESYVYLTDIYVREGQLDKAIAAVDTYKSQHKDLNLMRNPNLADQLFLNGAQARLDKGDKDNVGTALQIAKDVATRHPSDFVGLKAREIINQVLNNTSITVSAEALAQAAQGEFQNKNYQAAVRAFKRVIRSLESPAEMQDYGLKSYAQLGLSLSLQERYLEASLAFMDGLRRFGKVTNDEKLPSKVVDTLNRAVRALKKQKKDKAFYDKIKARADQIAVRYGGEKSRGNVFFVKAQSLIDEGKYGQAIASLKGIDKKAPQFEIARTMLAFAHWKNRDLTSARKVIADYMKYIKDPLNDVQSGSPKAQYREMAVADANFYIGMMLADEAFGRNGQEATPAKKKDVIQAFRNYGKQYGKIREPYAKRAAYELIKSFVDLEQLSEGEAEYTELRKQFPNDPLMSNLAIVLFNARGANVAAIEEELKALGKDPAKAREFRESTAKWRSEIRKALSFATNYLGVERNPDYGLLRNASKMAAKLEDWDQSEFFLEKILKTYSENKKFRTKIDSFIKPELAGIKMQKGDFRAADDLIVDALKARPKSPSLMRLKVRALGGWCDFDKDMKFRRPQGLGKFKEAYQLLFANREGYSKYGRSLKKYSIEWYEYQFACLDMADKAAKQDSDYLKHAQSFFRIAQSTDDFNSLKKFGQRGNRLFQLFQRLRR